MKITRDGGWSPYLAGALAGLLLIASAWVSGKFVGASTTYVRSAGMLESLFSPERVKSLDYFVKEAPVIDWQWMFVIGIIIGSFISAITSGSFRTQALPDMWRERFGPSRVKRGAAALAGGVVAMYGARLADG
ncbi:MAG: YeeE/YedE family protein [Desulfobacteraceae bacterium]|nr:YeeE/YedE family protein [Desulfobacteraceae bacterium]